MWGRKDNHDGSPNWRSTSITEDIKAINAWGNESEESSPPHSPPPKEIQIPEELSPPLLLASPQEPESLPVINKTQPSPIEKTSLVKKPAGNLFYLFSCCGCEDSSEDKRHQLTSQVYKR